MLSYVKKIRHRLMEQSKLVTYLFYAFGEILLVVIGILIALQVNNWNEQNLERERELYYLNSIKASVNLSQDEFDRVIGDAVTISSSADTLFQLLAFEKHKELEGEVLDSLLIGAGDYSLISLNDGGIREILNTGSMGIIQEENIRLALASWDERLHKIRKFEEETKTLSGEYTAIVNEYVDAGRWIRELDSGVIPGKRSALYADHRLRNFLGQISRAHKGMYRRYSEERAWMDALVAHIETYLQSVK